VEFHVRERTESTTQDGERKRLINCAEMIGNLGRPETKHKSEKTKEKRKKKKKKK
jgi:hypothetical protein